MPRHKLVTGPHAGETPHEVMLRDPEWLLGAVERGDLRGVHLVEAEEVCRRAARIQVPVDEGDDCRDVVVFYSLHPNGDFGGFSIVRKSDRRLAEYARFSVAQSDYLDLTLPRRLAPKDPHATAVMLGGILFQVYGEPRPKLSPEECAAFFSDPQVIVFEDLREGSELPHGET